MRILILSLSLLMVLGCDGSKKKSIKQQAKTGGKNVPKNENHVSLKQIVKRGKLRVLTTDPVQYGLPRNLSPCDCEQALLSKFAKKLGIKLDVIVHERFDELIPALIAGKGDVIAANMTITKGRKRKILFTIPVATTTEQIVTRAENKAVKKLKDLSGKSIIIESGTCYWDNMKKLKSRMPSIKLVEAGPDVDTEELLSKVARGKYECTVADNNYVEAFLTYCPDIKVVYEFPDKQHIGWGVEKSSTGLLKALNTFLKKELAAYQKKDFKGDLPVIKNRRILRVLTRNNSSNYFIHRGVLMGFEYELARKFAKENNLQLVMVVPPSWNDLIPWLLAGKGDIIASSMTITEKRKKIKGLSFCQPYAEIRQVVVSRKGDKKLKGPDDLKGRTFVVRKSSSYWGTLEKLRNSGVDFKIKAAPSNMETFEIIEKVASGEYDLTLADENIVDIERARLGDKITTPLSAGKPGRYGWAVRSEDVKLKKAIDTFFKKKYKGTFYNVLYRKYFKNVKTRDKHRETVSGKDGFYISKYDDIIKKYAGKYEFPWCLIAAQIFMESRFNPTAESRLGTYGLMQLMPTTAAEVGIKNFHPPENNVHAGVKYLHKIRRRLKPKNIKKHNKYCLSLASYNAGYGHVIDARNLAEELKLDPNIWFNNVEKAIGLLSKRKYASRARYGYCRSEEVISYVKKIIFRFEAYANEEKNFKRKSTR